MKNLKLVIFGQNSAKFVFQNLEGGPYVGEIKNEGVNKDVNKGVLKEISENANLLKSPKVEEVIKTRNEEVVGKTIGNALIANFRLKSLGKETYNLDSSKVGWGASLIKYGDTSLKTYGSFKFRENNKIKGYELGLKASLPKIGNFSPSIKAQQSTKIKEGISSTSYEVGVGSSLKFENVYTKMEVNLQGLGINEGQRTEIINYLKMSPFGKDLPSLVALNYHYFIPNNKNSNKFILGLKQQVGNIYFQPNLVFKSDQKRVEGFLKVGYNF